jgi:hypothetical protein
MGVDAIRIPPERGREAGQTGENGMSDLSNAKAQLEQTEQALKAALLEADEVNETADKAGDAPDAANQQKKKGIGTNRGIETMLRSAYRVQMDLTGLADNKANMMISINGIIISIIIASVAPKLDANPWLLIPTVIFLIGTLISIVYAILAARPRVNTRPISLEDLRHSEGNILFFGNFANMPEEEFLEGMIDLVEDKTTLYETMIRNIYGLGSVLKKKFALLQVAYSMFMAALVLGVFSFLGVFVWILR